MAGNVEKTPTPVPMAGTSGEWQYEYYVGNGEATITGYTGSGVEVVVPAEVDGIPVKQLNHITLPEACERIFIPSSVDHISWPPFTQLPWDDKKLNEVIFLGDAPTLELNYISSIAIPTPVAKVSYGTTGWGTSFGSWPVIMTNAHGLAVSFDSTKGATLSDPIGPWHAVGSNVNLHAIPLPGYAFVSWSGDVQSANNPVLIQMNANKTVTVNFGPDNSDSDGDGLSNYQEVIIFHTNPNIAETTSPVAGLYLASQRQLERTAGQNDVLNNPNYFGLYTSNQILNLGLGGIVLNRNANNQLVLNYQILQSTDLQSWTTYQHNELIISNPPPDKMFLRVQAIGQ
jgi:hypothetical protein